MSPRIISSPSHTGLHGPCQPLKSQSHSSRPVFYSETSQHCVYYVELPQIRRRSPHSRRADCGPGLGGGGARSMADFLVAFLASHSPRVGAISDRRRLCQDRRSKPLFCFEYAETAEMSRLKQLIWLWGPHLKTQSQSPATGSACHGSWGRMRYRVSLFTRAPKDDSATSPEIAGSRHTWKIGACCVHP